MTDQAISDEYTPNRQERLRAIKKQKEARAKITKDQLWKAIDELRLALSEARRFERQIKLEMDRDRTVLSALLARTDNTAVITQEELDDLVGLRRLVFGEEPEGYRVEVIEVVLDDEDLIDDWGEEE